MLTVSLTVYPGNHTSVWGSFYSKAAGQWGYSCCHSVIAASYCTGTAGIEAAEAASVSNLLASAAARKSPPPPRSPPPARDGDDERVDQAGAYGKKRLGEEGIKLDKEKLERALRDEKKRKGGKREEWEDDGDERKRRKVGGAMGDKGFQVTEEEMEAYRMNKSTTEDPMANYVDDDDR